MRSGWVRGILVSAGVFCAASSFAAGPDPAAGRALYEQHCVLCHGPDGKGDGPLADELKVRPADLTQITKRRDGSFPEAELREIIDGRRKVRGHGGGQMPIWGRVFTREEKGAASQAEVDAKLDALVAYLRTIQVGPSKVAK